MSTKVVYIPIGRKTFDLKAGEEQREQSSKLLNTLADIVIEPEEIITDTGDMIEFLKKEDLGDVSYVVYQHATFADAAAVEELIQIVKAPIIVWSVREPSVGGRLRLNSLTGGNATSHHLKGAKHPYDFILGNAEEQQVKDRLMNYLKGVREEKEQHVKVINSPVEVSNKQKSEVEKVVSELQNIKIGVFGDHPPGFFFSGTNEAKLGEQLGVSVKYFDLNEAFEKCVELPREKWIGAIERAEKQVIGLNRSDETVERFAQFTTYVKEQIDQEELTGTAVRCYPEFFNKLGAAACSTLSQFTEDGIVSACESDIHGAISMSILQQLSKGSAPYLGDMVHVNEESNSVVFWHCGAGAYSLANPKTGARPGVHPNRKLGFTMEFGLKPGRVTIFRVSYTPEGYRMLIMSGEALDTPQRFNGTSVEVKLETEVTDTLYDLMDEGFEPHYALVYADVADELIELGKQLGIETVVYTNQLEEVSL
ncbi:L-fucose/L-arabinose isomerase family protein [Oceanobacillus locisalsi]|uniref:L-fucose/L-arabinose isomerase family protein n=1 Tax=Oceanobacillus locisalsi TaxID=546107 RepID=A0ABW3NMP4_9BACI